MVSTVNTYRKYEYWGQGTSGVNITGNYTIGLTSCILTSGSSWNDTTRTLVGDIERDCEKTWYYNQPWYFISNYETKQYKKTFLYATKSTNNKIISYNENTIKNLRFIPFDMVILGFSFLDFINDGMTQILSIVVDLIIFPINILNDLMQDFGILFVDFPNEYCFYGMVVSKLLYTPTDIIPDGQYTTTLGIGFFILMIFAVKLALYLSRKI